LDTPETLNGICTRLQAPLNGSFRKHLKVKDGRYPSMRQEQLLEKGGIRDEQVLLRMEDAVATRYAQYVPKEHDLIS